MIICCPHCNKPAFVGDIHTHLGNSVCPHCKNEYFVDYEGEDQDGEVISVGKVVQYDREQTEYLRNKMDKAAFEHYLEYATRQVSQWPTWKRNALGGFLVQEEVDLGCSVQVVSAY